MLARLAAVIDEATAAFEEYDYARALERTESFFWSFCDDYLELVKTRAYGPPTDPGPASARAALALALSVQLRLLAPILPFVTEEVWSWWRSGSIHTSTWPTPSEIDEARTATIGAGPAGPDSLTVLEMVTDVLGQVRRAKTTEKKSMRWPVATLTVADTAERIAALLSAEDDLRDAGGVATLVTTAAGPPGVTVELAAEE
jgi:valyl-tRNA synthetase